MKKTISIIVAIMLILSCVFALSACDNGEESSAYPEELTISVPNGAPALVISKLLADYSEIDGVKLNYTFEAGSAAIDNKVKNGEADIAVMPVNNAAVLYNGGIGIKLTSVNVYGQIYLVGSGAATSLDGLVGKVVYVIGQAGSPDLIFRGILEASEIPYEVSDEPIADKVAITYTTPSALVPLLKTKTAEYGILSEPQATMACAGTNGAVKVISDLQSVWSQKYLTSQTGFTQAGVVVKDTLLEKYPTLINDILNVIEQGATWFNANPAAAGEAVKNAGGAMPVTLNAKIAANCNIKYVTASAAKADVELFLTKVMAFDSAAVGGKLPSADFYYSAK